MKGSIERLGKSRYRIRMSLGIDSDGKRYRPSRVVHGTRAEAARAMRELIDQYESGRLPSGERLTYADFFEEWLRVVKTPEVSARTLEGYSSLFDTYLRESLGRFKLGRITALDIHEHRADMLSRGLAPKTVKHVQSLIGQSLRAAVRLRKIALNPAADVQTSRVSRKKAPPRAFDSSQTALFQGAYQGTRHAVLFDLALASGMRPGEYLGLGWPCVDYDAGAVRVERSLILTPGQAPCLGPPKTASSFRTIPLPPSIMARLRGHQQTQQAYREGIGELWTGEHDLVFPNDVGGFLDLANLRNRHFRPALQRAGLQGFRLYDLRHTHATMLLLAGVSPKVVQERLGHSSITQTLDTYSHVLPTMQASVAAQLEGLLFTPDPAPDTE